MRNPHLPSLAGRLAPSILLGLIIAVIGAVLEVALDHRPSTFGSLDDLAVGIVSALVVFAYEQRRYRALMRRLEMIASMNHHVRNALQAIAYFALRHSGAADHGDPRLRRAHSMGFG